MANTLTNLAPDLYESLDTVSRELTGLIPAVNRDSNAERAAVGQTVRSHVAPASEAADIVPNTNAPDTGDQVIGNKSVEITKARAVPVRWTGEEQKGVNSGSGYGNILRDQFAQAMRTLTNEIEADLAGLHAKASHAFGAAGTTPFASTLTDTANIRKLLVDSGAPTSDMQLVIDTTAGAKLRTLAQLTKANEANDASMLRQGTLLDVHGMAIRESAQILTPAAGAMASATTTAAALTVGQTVIPLATAGTGVVAAGDIVTIANDDTKYVIASVSFAGADPASGDTITLGGDGIRLAQASSAYAITVIAAAARNMAFDRNAIVLATRAPAIPEEGDQADDAMIITDPRSGLSFEVRLYKEYRRIKYEIAAAWGYEAMKSEHFKLLLG